MLAMTNCNAHILVVDDEPDVRSIVCGMLCESYRCAAASSAEEALSMLRLEKFDLVISDIVMDGMSGLELVPQARAIAPDTVVLMISGEHTIERAIEALRVGAFDYIKKPFNFQNVEAAVRRALEHHAVLRAKHSYENQLEELVKLRTAQLNHLAYYDTLTDLPNRILFQDRLTQRLALERPDRESLSMLLLSVDRFKNVSDTFGHALANRLLRDVAERLTKSVREGETVARFEGDEFALLLSGIRSTGDVVEIIHRINEALNRPFMLDDHEVFITVSMGITLAPDDGTDAATLLENAGAALYRAQEHGGNNHQFYALGMSANARQRLVLENGLCQAVERKEFKVYYQPQMDINGSRVVGMEALVRWQHPDFGLILPAEFIPLAEDSGLIVPLGEWVLRTACAQSKAWQDAGFARLSLSVNLSARQFQQENLSEAVIKILQETGLNPHDLELELTESSIMKNADSAARTLNELKTMGIKISIDDFGTGYSSLGYLKRLPIDILKIDHSFVRDVITDPHDAAMVLAIITLAHNLRLKVVAEGVETQEQLRFLHRARCDEWQGYLYSKPLSAESFEELLMQGQNLMFDNNGMNEIGL